MKSKVPREVYGRYQSDILNIKIVHFKCPHFMKNFNGNRYDKIKNPNNQIKRPHNKLFYLDNSKEGVC